MEEGPMIHAEPSRWLVAGGIIMTILLFPFIAIFWLLTQGLAVTIIGVIVMMGLLRILDIHAPFFNP